MNILNTKNVEMYQLPHGGEALLSSEWSKRKLGSEVARITVEAVNTTEPVAVSINKLDSEEMISTHEK